MKKKVNFYEDFKNEWVISDNERKLKKSIENDGWNWKVKLYCRGSIETNTYDIVKEGGEKVQIRYNDFGGGTTETSIEWRRNESRLKIQLRISGYNYPSFYKEEEGDLNELFAIEKLAEQVKMPEEFTWAFNHLRRDIEQKGQEYKPHYLCFFDVIITSENLRSAVAVLLIGPSKKRSNVSGEKYFIEYKIIMIYTSLKVKQYDNK